MYAGLLLVVNPTIAVEVFDDFGSALLRFRAELRGSQWPEWFAGPNLIEDSRAIQVFVRIAGSILAVSGLLNIAGIMG